MHRFPLYIIRKILIFFKRDAVLMVSFFLALLSAFFVPPSAKYLSYIDFRVLGLLLSLMIVVSGLSRKGVFRYAVSKLTGFCKNARILVAVLVGVCFFGSMLITNDVSLITFVPLAVLSLKESDNQKLLIPVIVLQTIAANLGSMFTPIGNPQNLYLYSLSRMRLADFLGTMAVPTAVSLALLGICILLIKPKKLIRSPFTDTIAFSKIIVWILLFTVCLLSVARVIPYYVSLGVVVIAALIADRKALFSADFALLLTFVFFFVLIGNIKNIPAVSKAIATVVQGHELSVGVLASQIVSNVPAAMLIAGFTSNYEPLLVGVNLGGLGTLIASMASLISYKFYCNTQDAHKGKYILVFTLANLAFLAVLWGVVYINF